MVMAKLRSGLSISLVTKELNRNLVPASVKVRILLKALPSMVKISRMRGTFKIPIARMSCARSPSPTVRQFMAFLLLLNR